MLLSRLILALLESAQLLIFADVQPEFAEYNPMVD
jgi:hypothetical protein